MVRGRTRAFLAGPPLLKAATGEIATEEELGGAEMHTQISAPATISPRTAMPCESRARSWPRWNGGRGAGHRQNLVPRYDQDELLGIMPILQIIGSPSHEQGTA